MTKTFRQRRLLYTVLAVVVFVGGGVLLRLLIYKSLGTATALNIFSDPAPKTTPAGKVAIQTAQPKPPPADNPEDLVKQIEKALGTKDITDWEWVLNTLFPALAAKDHAAAARLVAGIPAGDVHEQLLRRLARIWATADFADAVTWIATIKDDVDRKAAFEDACFEVGNSDPAEAISAWETLEFTADDHVLENLIQNWAAKDLPAVQAWLGTKPESKFRDQAVARVAYVMAKDKPAEAVVLAQAEIPAGPAQTEAVISVLSQWALHDLAGASAWVQRLPNGELAERARNELAGFQSK